MEVLYRGFDGLDIAFPGQIPDDLDRELDEAKVRACQQARSVPIRYRGIDMMVAETGARGGYAYRCDTGLDGATWLIKRPNPKDEWGIRVSSKSLALAQYGLGGVRAQLFEQLDRLDIGSCAERASIGRIDYAIDVLANGFELVPDNFVMHSHCSRADNIEPEPIQVHGKSGRVTSVTIGKMPGRQIIVYDKRAEAIEKHKVHWWEFWNAERRYQGRPELDPKDKDASQVWRVELRAGKRYLKDRWGITTFAQLDDKLGDLAQRAIDEVRYTTPCQDRNRARWPNAPLWDLIAEQLQEDLFEMCSKAEPGAIKEVIRKHHRDMLFNQVIGLSASWAVAAGYDSERKHEAINAVVKDIRKYAVRESKALANKMERVAERIMFLESPSAGNLQPTAQAKSEGTV